MVETIVYDGAAGTDLFVCFRRQDVISPLSAMADWKSTTYLYYYYDYYDHSTVYISLCYIHLAMSTSPPAPPALAQWQVNNVPPAAY